MPQQENLKTLFGVHFFYFSQTYDRHKFDTYRNEEEERVDTLRNTTGSLGGSGEVCG
jgi:hypothetical protein